jgi:hypothetical protein
MRKLCTPLLVTVLAVTLVGAWSGTSAAAWQPTKPVEFNVPADKAGPTSWPLHSPLFQKNNIADSHVVTNRSVAQVRGSSTSRERRGRPHHHHHPDNLFDALHGRFFNWKDLTRSAGWPWTGSSSG